MMMMITWIERVTFHHDDDDDGEDDVGDDLGGEGQERGDAQGDSSWHSLKQIMMMMPVMIGGSDGNGGATDGDDDHGGSGGGDDERMESLRTELVDLCVMPRLNDGGVLQGISSDIFAQYFMKFKWG